jgi:hypothetical protein
MFLFSLLVKGREGGSDLFSSIELFSLLINEIILLLTSIEVDVKIVTKITNNLFVIFDLNTMCLVFVNNN